jgi:hypothetical protein
VVIETVVRATLRPVDTMSGQPINPNDSQSKDVHRWLNAPETNIAIFSFLLNLAWEFWQSPFFEGHAVESVTDGAAI